MFANLAFDAEEESCLILVTKVEEPKFAPRSYGLFTALNKAHSLSSQNVLALPPAFQRYGVTLREATRWAKA